MSASLAEKYAGWLRGSDIVDLFESLEKVHGSISKAARECGLERKTVYDWKRKAGTENLKTATKAKVVAALLEQVPEETLDSMLERLLSQVHELLEVYLSTIYEHAMRETGREEFVRLSERFGDAFTKYAGLVAGRSGVETAAMFRGLTEKAAELAESVTMPPMMVYSSEQLERLLPTILTQARTIRPDDSELIDQMAKRLHVTPSLVGCLASQLQARDGPKISTGLICMKPTEPLGLSPMWYRGADLTRSTPYESELLRDTFETQTKTAGATQVPVWCPQ